MPPSIDPATYLGTVHLTVSDLARAVDFYQSALGLRVHRQDASVAALGAGADDLLVLVEQPGARPVRGTTGLYHFAILLPSRPDLARALRRLAETRTPLQGFADHLVSEAIYLPDPDGNGIEIYRDRPRNEWTWDGDAVRMATDPLDIDDLLAELQGDNTPYEGMPPGTVMGHVHLHVSDLAAAHHFYCDVLGFDLIARYGGAALFVSAGRYHHHIGLNTWAGVGAPPPPPDAVGLRYFELVLPTPAALAEVLARVEDAHISTEPHADGILLCDPSQNGILLRTAE
ncbi:MAG TPA: VOC family protein [Aggregatilinea sp.]|uniref:VOC family protein n=1 Tax=Aggregatilinea sp. TaxID=2806333 RepID=UPI002B530A97|nr:VOC family protein [Aggregatilinea sp.]HML20707.1 VOC family protein [Aggregatilinea sp.]